MTKLDFPTTNPDGSPLSEGDVWKGPNGVTYTYRVTATGYYWQGVTSEYTKDSNANIHVGDTPPLDPEPGDLWWDSSNDSGRLYMFYEDVDSTQWVEASPSGTGEEGEDGEPTLWDKNGNDLEPKVVTDNVVIGGDKITLNATDGSSTFAGGQTINISSSIDAVFAESTSGSYGNTLFAGIKNDNSPIGNYAFYGRRMSDNSLQNDWIITEEWIRATNQAIVPGLNTVSIELNMDGSSNFAGDMAIGTTGSFTPSTPAISLNAANGSASFAGNVNVNNEVILDSAGNRLIVGNTGFNNGVDSHTVVQSQGVSVNFSAADVTNGTSGLLIRDMAAATNAVTLNAEGSAMFAGDVSIGTTAPLAQESLRVTTSTPWNAVFQNENNASGDRVLYTVLGPNARNGASTFLECNIANVGPVSQLFGDGSAWFSSSKIRLKEDGGAEFTNVVRIGGLSPNPAAITLSATGAADFANDRIKFYTDGSSTFSNGNITFYTDGNANFAGTVQENVTRSGSIEILLEMDDDTKYTTTTDTDGNETRVYNGAVLDVKDRLTKTDAALQALRTAADAASDFATLKSAIATALADI